jgi:DDE family transposase
VGESANSPFQLSFNASPKIDFQGSRVTSDGGLILVRELDERLGFGELIPRHLTDSRRGKNTQFPFADLLRQSVYSRLAGYEDLNDAERLSQDPTFRLIGSEKNWDRGAALTSRLQTFETEMLAEEENFAGLGRLNRALIGRAEAMDSGYRTILDMDSTEVPVYGEQERSAYNGYFESTCFHPLLLRDQSDPAQPGGGTLLQQARDFRAVDQGRQAVGEDDAADLPPVPVERGAAVAEYHRLQPEEPVAAAGAAEANRKVVADQLAAAAGEDGRAAGEACSILLAFAGRKPSDAAPVRGHAAADRIAALAIRISQPPTEPNSVARGREGRNGVGRSVKRSTVPSSRSTLGSKNWPLCRPRGRDGATLNLTRLTVPFSGRQMYARSATGGENGNSE